MTIVIMDTKLTVFLVMTTLFIQAFTANTENQTPIIEAVNTLFSLPTSSNCRLLEPKAILFQQDMPCFAPPISDGGEEAIGTRDKIKEAAIKSLDKSKATVEDSARSAARLAKEAVDNTVKKLKKTLSTKHTPEEDEL